MLDIPAPGSVDIPQAPAHFGALVVQRSFALEPKAVSIWVKSAPGIFMDEATGDLSCSPEACFRQRRPKETKGTGRGTRAGLGGLAGAGRVRKDARVIGFLRY